MFAPFRLKSPIGEAYNMNADDTLSTKKALADLGHLEIPEGGLDEYPDMPMIDGVKSFQRANDLVDDGVMKPDGPTLKRLNESLVAEQEPAKRPPFAPIFMPEQGNPPGPAITPIALKRPVRASSNVDLGDTGKVKSALAALGLPLPEGPGDPYPTHDMFNNIRAFQRREGLAADGEMLPGGETEKRMNALLRETAATPSSGQKSAGGDGVQVAQQGGRTLPPGVSAGNSALSIFQKHFAKKALEGAAGAAGAAAIGTTGALTGDAAKEDDHPAGNARTDIAPPLPKVPGHEPPKEKLPDRMENIPPEVRKKLQETYPALEEIETTLEGFPDQRDELIQILILQAGSRGSPPTEERNNFLLDRMLDKLKGMDIPRKHVGGGTSGDAGYRPEYHFKENDGIPARRSDGRIEVRPTLEDLFQEDIQTVDTLADGKTLTKREGDAARDIKLHKEKNKERGGLTTYAKHPAMPIDQWKEIMGPKVDAYIEETFGRFRKK